MLLTRLIFLACGSQWLVPGICLASLQTFKITPESEWNADFFGVAVALDGNTALVGSGIDNGFDNVQTYLFDTSSGAMITTLSPEDGDPEDSFGSAVALRNNIALVGSYRDEDNGFESGSAYLFDITTKMQIAKLLPDDGVAHSEFGISVSINSNFALIGSRSDRSDQIGSGSAYLFDALTGAQLHKFSPGDGVSNDFFGSSVALNGSTALIGSPLDDDNGTDSGSAYLFDTTTGEQITKLKPDDGAEGDQFGASVALSGDLALIGSRFNDADGRETGAAYLFDTLTGTQLAKLVPNDRHARQARFGISVGISGNIAIIGSSFDSQNGHGAGSAYLFDLIAIQQLAKLLPDDGSVSDQFGHSVAISNNAVIAGSRFDDPDGSVYLFNIPTPATAPLLALGVATLLRRRHP
ncbi:MAG: FG-GAP repeat protein [Phycisphaeraceae bacterium]